MIAHVAEAGEDRGRVVLLIPSAPPLADVALEAALRVAKAFQSEIESLFVADCQLLDFASFPFAREISHSGRVTRALTPADIEHDLALHGRGMQRRVLAAASLSDIRARARSVAGNPVMALSSACAEKGPWNVVAMGEPMRASSATRIRDLFAEVDATTGFVLVGKTAVQTKGPVIALVEDAERVQGMLRAAERLAAVVGGEAQLWIVEQGRQRLEWMDAHVRLSLGLRAATLKLEGVDLEVESLTGLAARLRARGAGFVIARFGGRVASAEADHLEIIDQITGPLFLVR